MRTVLQKLLILSVMATGLVSIAAPSVVFADHSPPNAVSCSSLKDSILGISSWDKYLKCDPTNSDAVVAFHFPQDIWLVVLASFEILTRLAVYIAVGVIIYAGFKFMISQGNPEKIQEAKTIIQDALIGLGIALLATVIISFVAGSVA